MSLEDMFTKEYIREVVFGYDGDRIPGPDGFNMEFLKICPEVVGEDMVSFIQEFY